MASALVSTPIKSHKGLFSSRTAGGRMPLTPSPRQQSTTTTVPVNLNSSPCNSDDPSMKEGRPSSKSTYGGNLMSHLSRSVSASSRGSPKTNIALGAQTPRRDRALELGVSDFTLTGTGHGKTPSSAKSKKGSLRQKSNKTTLNYAGDRFIPNRSSSSALSHAGSSKLSVLERQRPKTSGSEGSATLSTAADDAAAALEALDINDEEADTYSKPSPNTVAYQDSLANACGVKLNTRILEFKPAPPESSKPIDLRQQYNRPLRPAGVSSAQTLSLIHI